MTQVFVIILILFASTLLAWQIFVFLFQRRGSSASTNILGATMFATGWWAMVNALEYLAPSLGGKLILANLQYPAISAIPVLWFLLGRSLGEDIDPSLVPKRLSQPILVLLWIMPLITSTLVWFDPLWGLVRSGFALDEVAGITVITKVYGPWFWVHGLWSYVLILWGSIAIIINVFRASKSKAQTLLLALAGLLPTLSNVLYILGIIPPAVDPTPLAFTLTGLFIILNVSRFKLLSLVDRAREAAVQNLRNGVIILDTQGRILYLNHFIKEVFGLTEKSLGLPLVDLHSPLGLIRLDLAPSIPDLIFYTPRQSWHFEILLGPADLSGKNSGSLLTLYDVSARARAEEQLTTLNHSLETRIQERTEELEVTNRLLRNELDRRRITEAQLAHNATHDPLTSLGNRILLLGRLDHAVARYQRDHKTTFSLMYLDFDGFKSINDNFGHDAGDLFLKEIAHRLKQSVRDIDTIARIGGDEFVVILDGLAEGPDLNKAAGRLYEELSKPVTIRHHHMVPSASIGIVCARPDIKTSQDALRDADIAMYQAKSEGKNRYVFFDESMRNKALEHGRLSLDLGSAIGRGEIQIAYQPIVQRHGRVAGWEVLARWTHGELGVISPDRFIPLAESSGLIVQLGAHMLQQTLLMAQGLLAKDLLPKDPDHGFPFFSVNVSAIQLTLPEFPAMVLDLVNKSGIPRSMLRLELTETAFIDQFETIIEAITYLQDQGIHFKLDDFGTGYSSLSYLDRIPITTLKIDRGFTIRMGETKDEPDSSSRLMRGIVSLSHALGKSVVVEGVETNYQAQMVWELGCEYCQGYFFGRPMDSRSLIVSLEPKQ